MSYMMNPHNINLKYGGRLDESQIKDAFKTTLVVNFDITERCNLECEYCAYGDLYDNYGIRNNRDLNVNYAYKLLDYLLDRINMENVSKIKRIIYLGFYGGEPLIRMDIVKLIVDYAEKKLNSVIEFKYSMTTNGTLLDQHMDYLVDKNFKLLLSLDGNKEHNSYRVFKNKKESFSTVYANSKALRHKYPSFYQSNVNFNSVIHSRNNKIEVYKFFTDKLDKIPDMPEVSNSGIEECKDNGIRNKYTEEDKVTLRDILNYQKYVSKIVYRDYADLFTIGNIPPSLIPTATCTPFSRRIHLCVDGTVLPCEKIGKEFSFGTVSEQGVDIDFSHVCKTMNKLFDKVEAQCEKCGKQIFCQLCILQYAKPNKAFVCPDFIRKDKLVFERIEQEFVEKPAKLKKIMNEYYEF